MRGVVGAEVGVALVAAAAAALGAIPRIARAIEQSADPLRPVAWSDVLVVYARGLSGHRLPYWDVPFEYPPLIGYVSGAFSVVANEPVTFVAMWATVQVAGAAAVGAILAREAGPRRALLAWALAPQLLLYATMNFDVVALTALVLAIMWSRAGRAVPASAALALGAAAKLFPTAALPVLLVRGHGRSAVLSAVAFGSVVALAFVPGLFADHSTAFTLYRYSAGLEANADSVWGLLGTLLVSLGASEGRSIVPLLALAGMTVTYGTLVIPAALRARDPAVPFGLAVLTLLLWSPLYSPQYSLWVLPFVALVPAGWRTYGAVTAADLAVFGAMYAITPGPPDAPLGIAHVAVAVGVMARHAALVALAVDLRRRVP